MMNTLHAILISIATAVGGGFSGWFFTRKKYNTEVDANMIKNLKSSLDFYKETIDYNEKKLNSLIDKIEKAEAKNEQLEEEIRTLRDKLFKIIELVCVNFTCTLRKKDFNLFGNEIITEKNIQKG